MISDERKLFIHIAVTAFRTSDKEVLERYANTIANQLDEEEIDYAITLMKGEVKK